MPRGRRSRSAAVGASIAHLLRSRQRLAQPLHVRPELRDQGRLWAQRRLERRRSGCPTTRTSYYGEPYVKTLDLAPNAIVLLHHLCYASGNSEPGHAQPTDDGRPPAHQQLRRGLPAVACAGRARRRPSRTGRLSPRAVHDRPDDRGDVAHGAGATTATSVSFTSTRTSGVKSLMDPEGSSSGFYRSLVTDPTLTTNHGHRHRRHQPRSGDAGGARPGFGPRPRAPPSAPTSATAADRGGARHEHAHAARHAAARTRPPERDGRRCAPSRRGRRARRPVHPRGVRVADLRPRDSAPPRSSRWILRRRSSRRTATALPTRSPSARPVGDRRVDVPRPRRRWGDHSTRRPATAGAQRDLGRPRRWRAGHEGIYAYRIDATDAWTNAGSRPARSPSI